jgi:hypothetical protein
VFVAKKLPDVALSAAIVGIDHLTGQSAYSQHQIAIVSGMLILMYLVHASPIGLNAHLMR